MILLDWTTVEYLKEEKGKNRKRKIRPVWERSVPEIQLSGLLIKQKKKEIPLKFPWYLKLLRRFCVGGRWVAITVWRRLWEAPMIGNSIYPNYWDPTYFTGIYRNHCTTFFKNKCEASLSFIFSDNYPRNIFFTGDFYYILHHKNVVFFQHGCGKNAAHFSFQPNKLYPSVCRPPRFCCIGSNWVFLPITCCPYPINFNSPVYQIKLHRIRSFLRKF